MLTGWEHSSAGNQLYIKSISSDGKPNLAFANNGVFRTTLEGNNNRGIAAVSVETDQLFIGINTGNDSHTNFGIICLKNDGTLDKTFGTDGIVITQTDNIDQLQKIEIQHNGKILLAGTRFNGETVDILVVRYNKDGSIDESFGNNGTVTIDIEAGSSDFLTDIALASNSNILVSGYTDASGKFDVFISRFNAAGNLDSSFGAQGIALINFGGNDTATDMVIQDDGKIVVVHSWNKYCNTCSKQKPILKKAKKDFKNIIFMNFEQTRNKDIAKLLKINYWATIVVYKNNNELAREIGIYNKEDIYNLIKKGI